MILILLAVGGILVIYLFSSLLEWAIFKRLVNTAPVGISLSVAAAVALAVVLHGFGNSEGGGWNPLPGGVAYILAGAVVWALKLASYRRRFAAARSKGDLADIFE